MKDGHTHFMHPSMGGDNHKGPMMGCPMMQNMMSPMMMCPMMHIINPLISYPSAGYPMMGCPMMQGMMNPMMMNQMMAPNIDYPIEEEE